MTTIKNPRHAAVVLGEISEATGRKGAQIAVKYACQECGADATYEYHKRKGHKRARHDHDLCDTCFRKAVAKANGGVK